MTLDQVVIVVARASSAFAETVPSHGLAAKAVDIAVGLDHPCTTASIWRWPRRAPPGW